MLRTTQDPATASSSRSRRLWALPLPRRPQALQGALQGVPPGAYPAALLRGHHPGVGPGALHVHAGGPRPDRARAGTPGTGTASPTRAGRCPPRPPPGLSPRVRGNPKVVARCARDVGSIPACAGEPCRQHPGRPEGRVYPRVCGGTRSSKRATWSRYGLSPRVRGNRLLEDVALHPIGSIPACAGEPLGSDGRTPKARVYPRVCGGTCVAPDEDQHELGLSPRVRGNPQQAAFQLRRKGSIPACAGEPRIPRSPSAHGGVYPRVCGGTLPCTVGRRMVPGLSPRVRGNPLRTPPCFTPKGSIPACAGEPTDQNLTALSRRVYPRVCGGT